MQKTLVEIGLAFHIPEEKEETVNLLVPSPDPGEINIRTTVSDGAFIF